MDQPVELERPLPRGTTAHAFERAALTPGLGVIPWGKSGFSHRTAAR